MALCGARDEADERLLHHPRLRDAMGVDSKQAHAALRPEVASNSWSDARFDEANDEVATEGFTLVAEQHEVLVAECLAAGQLVAQAGLAQLEDACKEAPQLGVLNNRLWPPTLRNPERCEAVQLLLLFGADWRRGHVDLGGERIGDHLYRCLDLPHSEDVVPLAAVLLGEVCAVATGACFNQRPQPRASIFSRSSSKRLSCALESPT
mmetsp:Transcript_27511/g.63138  ORF Transcript_27511/g.63138 Transcript_27511/m.63138 type:complete len:207 (-) Transcript_27511:411-1031(-)